MSKLPVYFVSHGGGPWPWMKAQFGGAFDNLEKSLHVLADDINGSAKAILMISGHWEAPQFSVSSSANPPMLYDYSGFPSEAYSIQYPAPGEPALAAQVQQLLNDQQFPTVLDDQRGYDHGTFTVMYSMYPEADMPVVQLSLRSDLDPEAHLKVGQALQPLREEGVVIIGSGLSFHNLRMRGPESAEPSAAFDRWLHSSLVDQSSAQRWEHLKHWRDAPHARIAHPTEDHLMPLMTAVGAAGEDAAECFYHEDDFMQFWSVSSFRFGEKP